MKYISAIFLLLSIILAQPDISVSPDSLYQHLYTNGDSTQVLTIYNIGSDTLDAVLSISILPSSETITISYWVQAGPDSPEADDELKVYYYSNANSWVEIRRIDDGDAQGYFVQFIDEIAIPDINIDNFKIKFEQDSYSGGDYDHYYIDDVKISTDGTILFDDQFTTEISSSNWPEQSGISLTSSYNYSSSYSMMFDGGSGPRYAISKSLQIYVTPDWITLSDSIISVSPSDNAQIICTLNATGLAPGRDSTNIIITSNDPTADSLITIPVTLNVTGIPDISVSADTLDFGSLVLPDTSTISFIITNDGTDTLVVTDIQSSNPFYTVDTTSFSLAVDSSRTMTVTFLPTSNGSQDAPHTSII